MEIWKIFEISVDLIWLEISLLPLILEGNIDYFSKTGSLGNLMKPN
jgi:hypothetical protein